MRARGVGGLGGGLIIVHLIFLLCLSDFLVGIKQENDPPPPAPRTFALDSLLLVRAGNQIILEYQPTFPKPFSQVFLKLKFFASEVRHIPSGVSKEEKLNYNDNNNHNMVLSGTSLSP